MCYKQKTDNFRMVFASQEVLKEFHIAGKTVITVNFCLTWISNICSTGPIFGLTKKQAYCFRAVPPTGVGGCSLLQYSCRYYTCIWHDSSAKTTGVTQYFILIYLYFSKTSCAQNLKQLAVWLGCKEKPGIFPIWVHQTRKILLNSEFTKYGYWFIVAVVVITFMNCSIPDYLGLKAIYTSGQYKSMILIKCKISKALFN